MLSVERTLAEQFHGERMARREFQMPSVLQHDGPRPYWYIRYRRKMLVGRNEIRREEKWHRLGYCDEMTKREAERRGSEVLREVNNEVYTIQSQVPFGEFVKTYIEQHVSTLAPGPKQKYTSLLNNHILPMFGEKRMCDIRTDAVQAFLNQKDIEGLAWWTRNDLKGIISGIYTKAADWGYWREKNPALRTTLGRKKPKRQKLILTGEVQRVVGHVLPLRPIAGVERAMGNQVEQRAESEPYRRPCRDPAQYRFLARILNDCV